MEKKYTFMTDIKKNDKISNFIKKVKDIKNIRLITCIIVVGLILLIYYGITQENKDTDISQISISDEISVEDTTLDNKLENILSIISGVGNASVLINIAEDNSIIGVIVVAEGANNKLTELRIRQAVTTALNIKSDKIEVYSMK